MKKTNNFPQGKGLNKFLNRDNKNNFELVLYTTLKYIHWRNCYKVGKTKKLSHNSCD